MKTPKTHKEIYLLLLSSPKTKCKENYFGLSVLGFVSLRYKTKTSIFINFFLSSSFLFLLNNLYDMPYMTYILNVN